MRSRCSPSRAGARCCGSWPSASARRARSPIASTSRARRSPSTCGSCSRPGLVQRAARRRAALVLAPGPRGSRTSAPTSTRCGRRRWRGSRRPPSTSTRGSARCRTQLSRCATSCGSRRRRRWCSPTSPTRAGWSSGWASARCSTRVPVARCASTPTAATSSVGEYVELEPPRRVVFTWGFEGDERAIVAGASRVEVVLEPADGDGDAADALPSRPPVLRPALARARAGTTTWSASAVRPPAIRPGRDPWLATD